MIGSYQLYKLTEISVYQCNYNFTTYFHLPFVWNLHEDIHVLNIPDIII